jgi:hypothetical protein
VRGIAVVAFLLLAYWNYDTFFGGMLRADASSPDCIKTEGTVTDVHASKGGRKTRDTYHMTYDYRVEGKTYSTKEEVTYNIFNRVKLNDRVEVCYMKDHPGRSAVVGNDIRGERGFLVILVDVAVVIVVVIVIRAGIKRRRGGK